MMSLLVAKAPYFLQEVHLSSYFALMEARGLQARIYSPLALLLMITTAYSTNTMLCTFHRFTL